jgi:Zinc knuckle
MARSHHSDESEDQAAPGHRKSLATGRHLGPELNFHNDDPPELNAFLALKTSDDVAKFIQNKEADFILRAVKQATNTICDWDQQILSLTTSKHELMQEKLELEENVLTLDQRVINLEDVVKQRDNTLIEKDGAIKMLQELKLTSEKGGNTSRSTKAPDPELFGGNDDPSFNHWKLQMQGKFTINGDHFPDERSKMIYFFSRTRDNAAEHLQPRYEQDAVEPFESVEQMFQHLDAIYLDPFEKSNARKKFKKLLMTDLETFPPFYTRFLHLCGKAKIPKSELVEELSDKISIPLREAILPTLNQYDSLDELARQLSFMDNEQRSIKLRKNQVARIRANRDGATPSPKPSTSSTPVKPAQEQGILRLNGTQPPTSNLTSSTRPTYADTSKQETSDKGLCHTCRKPGHFAKDCPEDPKRVHFHAIHTELEEDIQAEQELSDREAGNGQA